MRYHIAATALAAACLIAGCGFTPKQPPKPDDGRRVPVNQAPPFPHTWPRQDSNRIPISELGNHPTQLVGDTVGAPIALEEEKSNSTALAKTQLTKSASATVLTGNVQATGFFWPITLPFHRGESMATPSDLRRPHFNWPASEESEAVSDEDTTVDESIADLSSSDEVQTFWVHRERNYQRVSSEDCPEYKVPICQ